MKCQVFNGNGEGIMVSLNKRLSFKFHFRIVLALFLLFVGIPSFQRGHFLDTTLMAHELKIPKTSVDSIFEKKWFSTEEKMKQYVNLIYADKIPQKKEVAIWSRDNRKIVTHKDEETYVIIFLSISFICILLSLLGKEITTLKVGMIEIQKSDQQSLMDEIEVKMSR